MTTTRETILAQIDELQTWFARKPFGWTAQATPEQLQQWVDRESEMARLNEVLIDLS